MYTVRIQLCINTEAKSRIGKIGGNCNVLLKMYFLTFQFFLQEYMSLLDLDGHILYWKL